MLIGDGSDEVIMTRWNASFVYRQRVLVVGEGSLPGVYFKVYLKESTDDGE
jgi:hypothetical protein